MTKKGFLLFLAGVAAWDIFHDAGARLHMHSECIAPAELKPLSATSTGAAPIKGRISVTLPMLGASLVGTVNA